MLEILRRHHQREELLGDHDLPAVTYYGGLTRREKDAAIADFQGAAPILLSTEAAGEGRNLQFCHVMVNFDLPWNPMQIEQRLGRIHRIGQEEEVLLTNLVARGTVEERLLGVLQAKINLFELVVGELDMILGRIEEELDFERLVFDEYVASRATASSRPGSRPSGMTWHVHGPATSRIGAAPTSSSRTPRRREAADQKSNPTRRWPADRP